MDRRLVTHDANSILNLILGREAILCCASPLGLDTIHNLPLRLGPSLCVRVCTRASILVSYWVRTTYPLWGTFTLWDINLVPHSVKVPQRTPYGMKASKMAFLEIPHRGCMWSLCETKHKYCSPQRHFVCACLYVPHKNTMVSILGPYKGVSGPHKEVSTRVSGTNTQYPIVRYPTCILVWGCVCV